MSVLGDLGRVALDHEFTSHVGVVMLVNRLFKFPSVN